MTGKLPRRALTRPPGPRFARAERRFSLGTLMVGTVFFAVLFALLARFEVHWSIVTAIVVFLVGIASAQMLIRDEKKARGASMLAGLVLYILAAIVLSVSSYGPWIHVGLRDLCGLMSLGLTGLVAGYIGGVFVAGIFLISQIVDDALSSRRAPYGAGPVEASMTRQPTIAHTVEEVRARVRSALLEGRKIGFVPTMGSLHEGHLSLIRQARAETDFVVVSIFVNPTQFGPQEDLSRYPRPFYEDVRLCRQEGVDLVFAPQATTIYPLAFSSLVEVESLSGRMEGAFRPGHFRGVATVVLKLFNIVGPDIAYFGQKDAQQARVIQQMVRDLNVPVEIRVCPTVRAPDGLALSSRNQYLSADDRRSALALSQSMRAAQEMIDSGSREPNSVRQKMRAVLESVPNVVPDYAELVDPITFEPVDRIAGSVLAVVAARVGTTRLIDNLLICVKS